MAQTNYAGINYGLHTTNMDVETGIRYGVISQHSIMLEAMDDFESDYGDPCCPKCGNDAIDIPSHTESSDPPGQWVRVIQDIPEKYEDYEIARGACANYACENCEYLFDGDEAYPDEALGFSYDNDGYKLTDCLDSDIFVLKSPYFTYAQFCSPCVPGACNLDSPLEQQEPDNKCYCLGHDWFEASRAPYRVYSVATGVIVEPELQGSKSNA